MIITKISQQKSNKKRFSIYVDDKYSFSMDELDLLRLGLKENNDISKDDLTQYKDYYEYKSAKSTAIKYLCRKMRSAHEINDKLKLKGYSNDIITRVIDELAELKYIDDEALSQFFINDTSKFNPCGKRLLKAKLAQKGINKNIIDEKLSGIGEDGEIALAKKLINKKFKDIFGFDRKETYKVYQFLLRKGFDYDVIDKAVRECLE